MLLQDYDVTIMTGDWHTEGTTRVSDRIVEYVHPAVTGNWWYRQGICCNGYPAAFTEYVFRGDRLESRSLIDWANGNSKQQYRVHNKGVTSEHGHRKLLGLDPAGGAPSVLVFFWGRSPQLDLRLPRERRADLRTRTAGPALRSAGPVRWSKRASSPTNATVAQTETRASLSLHPEGPRRRDRDRWHGPYPQPRLPRSHAGSNAERSTPKTLSDNMRKLCK